MQIFINDMSLNGQFNSVGRFKETLEPLLKLRHKEPSLRKNLLCSSQLSDQYVTPGLKFKQCFYQSPDDNLKKLVLRWITKEGPFWEENRYFNQDDYFECQGRDVTDQGLGEAARRNVGNIATSSFSFQDSGYEFETSPLIIQHGLPESPIGHISIENSWLIDQIKELIKLGRPEPCNWKETIKCAEDEFSGLIIDRDQIIKQLKPHPFSQQLKVRIFDLLRTLNDLVEETRVDGSLTAKGKELHSSHFIGEKAWFTDESENNRNIFKQQLSFPDPLSPEYSLLCGWHGKIKTPQFRIHFEWPRPSGQKEIKVGYIGPKITKH